LAIIQEQGLGKRLCVLPKDSFSGFWFWLNLQKIKSLSGKYWHFSLEFLVASSQKVPVALVS
jgi:hypothetical protein